MNLINYIPTSAVCFAATLSLSQASELPKDFEVVSKSRIAEIQNNPGYPETSSFQQETQYLDFNLGNLAVDHMHAGFFHP